MFNKEIPFDPHKRTTLKILAATFLGVTAPPINRSKQDESGENILPDDTPTIGPNLVTPEWLTKRMSNGITYGVYTDGRDQNGQIHPRGMYPEALGAKNYKSLLVSGSSNVCARNRAREAKEVERIRLIAETDTQGLSENDLTTLLTEIYAREDNSGDHIRNMDRDGLPPYFVPTDLCIPNNLPYGVRLLRTGSQIKADRDNVRNIATFGGLIVVAGSARIILPSLASRSASAARGLRNRS